MLKILEDSSKGLVDGKKKLADIKAEMPATEKKIKNWQIKFVILNLKRI